MSAYIRGDGLPFVVHVLNAYPTDVEPLVARAMKEGRVVTVEMMPTDADSSTVVVLANLRHVANVLITEVPPEDLDGRAVIPFELADFERAL